MGSVAMAVNSCVDGTWLDARAVLIKSGPRPINQQSLKNMSSRNGVGLTKRHMKVPVVHAGTLHIATQTGSTLDIRRSYIFIRLQHV